MAVGKGAFFFILFVRPEEYDTAAGALGL
jgi:hypothetical protein